MESLESANSTNMKPMDNMKEENKPRDDIDFFFHQYNHDGVNEDNDEIDDEEFCSSILKPQSSEIIGGLNLKDLCEGKEVMFKLNDTYIDHDEEQFNEENHDAEQFNEENHDAEQLNEEDHDKQHSDDEETVNKLYKGGFEQRKNHQVDLYLNESFDALVSRMTSITDDDCIKKEEIISGVGDVIPENSFVVVHYNLFKKTCEEPFDSTYLRRRPERVYLGQNDLIPGLDIAIKTMKKRENSRFYIKWNYAFGALGCPDRIEPECDVLADITIINFREMDAPELDDDCGSSFEKSVLRIKLEQTNASESFKEGHLKQAIKQYKISTRMIENLAIADSADERIYFELKSKSLVNLAICYNKMAKYELACVMCQEALSINSKNTKALFHYARASIALSNFTKARNLLIKLNRMHPHNKYINEEFRKLDLKKQIYNMTTKGFWEKAFKGGSRKKGRKTNSQESNSRCENSRDHPNGDHKEGSNESNEDDFRQRLPAFLTQQDDKFCKKFEENMNLEDQSENLMELE